MHVCAFAHKTLQTIILELYDASLKFSGSMKMGVLKGFSFEIWMWDELFSHQRFLS